MEKSSMLLFLLFLAFVLKVQHQTCKDQHQNYDVTDLCGKRCSVGINACCDPDKDQR